MYHLRTIILIAFLLTCTLAYAGSAIEAGAEDAAPSAEQLNDSEDSQSSGDTITAVCQSDPKLPCCCKSGGSRSCTSKSECENIGGKCTTNDAYGNCP